MHNHRIAIAAVFVAGLATLPISATKAQPYYPYCNPVPLSWPFCAAAVIVGTAGEIVTAPFRALAGRAYYSPYYYGSPAPYAYPSTGAYYPPSNYSAPVPGYPSAPPPAAR